MVFRLECHWTHKVQKNVDLIDLVKSFPYSNEYLVAKYGFDTAENESSKVCQQVVRQLDRLSYDKYTN